MPTGICAAAAATLGQGDRAGSGAGRTLEALRAARVGLGALLRW